MSFHAIRAIYLFEMARTWRTLLQSLFTPVIRHSLYFVVRLGDRLEDAGDRWDSFAPSSCRV